MFNRSAKCNIFPKGFFLLLCRALCLANAWSLSLSLGQQFMIWETVLNHKTQNLIYVEFYNPELNQKSLNFVHDVIIHLRCRNGKIILQQLTYANHNDEKIEELRRWSDQESHQVAKCAPKNCSYHNVYWNEPPVHCHPPILHPPTHNLSIIKVQIQLLNGSSQKFHNLSSLHHSSVIAIRALVVAWAFAS